MNAPAVIGVAFGLLTVSVPTAPLLMTMLTGLAVKVSVGAPTPVPVSASVCGLPVALLVTVSVPTATPNTVGLKVSVTVQLAAAAREAPQVVALVTNGPLGVIDANAMAPTSLLVIVTTCALLAFPSGVVAKLGNGDGDRTSGATALTVAVTTGLNAVNNWLELIEFNCAVNMPVATGEVTLAANVHALFAARVALLRLNPVAPGVADTTPPQVEFALAKGATTSVPMETLAVTALSAVALGLVKVMVSGVPLVPVAIVPTVNAMVAVASRRLVVLADNATDADGVLNASEVIVNVPVDVVTVPGAA